jgi:hypothetical protein
MANLQGMVSTAFKEKRAICRRRAFDYDNSDEPTANTENRFRIKYLM